MGDMNTFLLGTFIAHPFLASFFVPLFFGEAGFVLLSFLAGLNGSAFLLVLIFFGSLADVSNDLFWFWVPRSKFLKRRRIFAKILKKTEKMGRRFRKFERWSLFSFIMGSKFLVGTRLFAVVSVSLDKVKFRKFLLVSVVSAFLWSLIIVAFGWLAGRGFLMIFDLFNGARKGITIITIIIVLVVLARKFMHDHSTKILIKPKEIDNVS
ncbi:MAG: hypothetical protein ABIF18_03165 [archaeon]